jgi:hypothetical protein
MTRAAGAYVTRMDASGNFVWATRVGDFTTAAVYSEGLAIDSAGNVFLTASQVPLSKKNVSPSDGQYIRRLNANGIILESWRIGPNRHYGNPELGAFTNSLAVDAADHLWAAGSFYNENLFPDGTTLRSVSNTADLFVLRFDDVQLAMSDIAASIDKLHV